MPFRAKLRKTFSRGSSSGASSEESSTLGDDNKSEPKFLYYKPGEKIPYKYRRPVDKAHKEKLEAFDFSNAWRRRSFQSEYSPMGSKMPSRKNSIEMQMGRRGADIRLGEVGQLSERDHEGPPANLGRNSSDGSDNSDDTRPFTPSEDDGFRSPSSADNFTHRRVRNDTPFTAADLSLALQQSRLEVPP